MYLRYRKGLGAMRWQWRDGTFHDAPQPGTAQAAEVAAGTSPAFVGHPEVLQQFAPSLSPVAFSVAYQSTYGTPLPPAAAPPAPVLQKCPPGATTAAQQCIAANVASYNDYNATVTAQNANPLLAAVAEAKAGLAPPSAIPAAPTVSPAAQAPTAPAAPAAAPAVTPQAVTATQAAGQANYSAAPPVAATSTIPTQGTNFIPTPTPSVLPAVSYSWPQLDQWLPSGVSSFLTDQSIISGIPNWLFLVAGALIWIKSEG